MKSNSSDFYIVIIPILIMVSLAWIYLFAFSNEMDMDMDMNMSNVMNMDSQDMDMNSMDMNNDMNMDLSNKFSLFTMPMDGNWTVNDFIVMNIMWIMMMCAIMCPSSLMFLFLLYSMSSNMSIVMILKSDIVLQSQMYFEIRTIFSMVAC